MDTKPVRTAVIGSGAISDIYLENMTKRFHDLDVVACSSRNMESAKKQAEKHGLQARTNEEIFKDPEIELVVVLTPAPTHYGIIKDALLSGKHVYTEKPISTTVEEAKELMKLADEKGLYLGSAPDTFLGSSLQTARKAIDDGLIGEVTSFNVVANRDITLLASFVGFLRMPYGGIAYDYGVYYLTALVSLLGPMKKVYSIVSNYKKNRINSFPQSPDFGKEYVYDNESQVDAILTTESGITGTFALNGDSALFDMGYFTIHGTKGILELGNPNDFGGDVTYIPNDLSAFVTGVKPQKLEPVSPLSDNSRGIGPAEMALAIRNKGRNRASKELACHVLDIIEQMMESSKAESVREIETSCERPEAFIESELFEQE